MQIFSYKIDLNPWQYLVFSFALLIAFGSFLLQMPFVHHTQGVSEIDAVFTATSAVCVTGLVSIPTSGFNTAGQLSILLLIQLGAIGIMTLTSSFLLLLKGGLKLKHKLSFSKTQDIFQIQDAHDILRNILRITFVTEFIGFVLLSYGFLMEGNTVSEALYQGMFHSVSAFCNAGFSTYDSSIIGLNPLIKYTISFLIIMGGLGYFVILDALLRFRTKRKMSFHSKIVLFTTLFLLVLGTVLLYLFEKGNMSWTDSIFQSVTTRTAGFNSVDMNALSYDSIFIMYILMFIGASPGSTGGGIKTTSFFVIAYSIFSLLRGKTEVVIFNRTITHKQILKAFATAFVYLLVIVIGSILLMEDNSIPIQDVVFETVSAIGTVGLSLGITTQLTVFGKIVIILLMFVGRIGPASLALATMRKEKNVVIKYPQGDLY